MDVVERLDAIEQIKQVKSSYFRGLDTRDWTLIREIFSSTPSADYRGAVDVEEAEDEATVANAVNTQVLTDIEMIATGLRDALEGCKSLHLGSNPEVELLPDGTARGVWAMQDWLWFDNATPKTRLRGHGHYHNTFVKEDGRWKIKTLKLSRVNVQVSTYE